MPVGLLCCAVTRSLLRAIGDVALQPYITCEPEIMDKLLDINDEYLVIATDGLWDVLENEEVARMVLSGKYDKIGLDPCCTFFSILLCRRERLHKYSEEIVHGSGNHGFQ